MTPSRFLAGRRLLAVTWIVLLCICAGSAAWHADAAPAGPGAHLAWPQPAGWSADAAVNKVVSDRTGHQVVPKIAALSDGGVYLSWFEAVTEGYDVALQRIDADGRDVWPQNGIFVADLKHTTVSDYDLAVDHSDNAIIAFNDDREEREQISVTMVTPDGVLGWGAEGVRVPRTVGQVLLPRLAVASDGLVWVAWCEGRDLKLYKLDAGGAPVLAETITITDAGGAQLYTADLQPADAGGVILSWISAPGSPSTARHLFAQKYSVDGTPLWGQAGTEPGSRLPVALFDTGTLQEGNFPAFVPDGQGGAVFAWYEVDPWLVHVQRIRSDGTAVLAAGGLVAADPEPNVKHVEPTVAFDGATQDIYVFFRAPTMSGPPNQMGFVGQRVTAAGRQWGDGGLKLEHDTGLPITQLTALPSDHGVIVGYVEALEYGKQTAYVRRLDAAGADVWSQGRLAVASAQSGISELGGVWSVLGFAVFAWQDTRTVGEGHDDIYAQNVFADGRLGPLTGGWSADPTVNAVIGDGASEQVQPKLVPTRDGGLYVSWYDNAAGGYDVALQRLDAHGHEVWPHNGLVIADRSLQWTSDYDLDVDAVGNAVIAFGDDRSGRAEVTVAKVAPSGDMLWGPTGIQMPRTGEMVEWPLLTVSTDGYVWIAWIEDDHALVTKLNADGTFAFAQPLQFSATLGRQVQPTDLEATENGSVILSWCADRGSDTPRHLYAQKLAADGTALWGEPSGTSDRQPVTVFDGGRIQSGNFPGFVPDGAGGAVFAWYEVDPNQSRVQWVRPDGSLVFAVNGIVVATPGENENLVEPTVAFDRSTQDIYVVLRVTLKQGVVFQRGLIAQRITAAGLQWGDRGKAVEGDNHQVLLELDSLPVEGGVLLSYIETSGAGSQRIWMRRLDAQGQDVWPGGRLAVSDATLGKMNVGATWSTAGFAVLGWQDRGQNEPRTDDVRVQRVFADGGLEPAVPGWSSDPTVNTVLAGRANDQVQPKLAPISDGGMYVSWFDNLGYGYDVMLQRLDAGGHALWPANGVQLADREYLWTTDYDLIADAADNAVIAFADNRSGTQEITVMKVSPSGDIVWDVQMPHESETVEWPLLTLSSDGSIWVAYIEGMESRLTKLSGDGQQALAQPLKIVDRPTREVQPTELRATENGSVILSWVADSGTNTPRHLYTQKYAADGTALWGEPTGTAGERTAVVVFDSGSIQSGNFPGFVLDGAGGAVFAWYQIYPYVSRVQWVRPDGSSVFVAGGIPAASPESGERLVEPAVTFDLSTQAIYVVIRVALESGTAFQSGLIEQRITAEGLQWGDRGKRIEAGNPDTLFNLNLLPLDGGFLLAYTDEVLPGATRNWIRRLNASGEDVWKGGRVAISGISGGTLGLVSTWSTAGFAVLGWADRTGGTSATDIRVQNVYDDGSLGFPAPEVSHAVYLPRLYREQ